MELAAAGAEMGATLAAARQLSGTALVQQVVKPTVASLNPFDPSGPIGKVAIVLVLFVGVGLLLRVRGK
jgi:hypothetical protein